LQNDAEIPKENSGAIAGGCIGAIVFCALVIIVVVVIIR
jgi:hypothetical protein